MLNSIGSALRTGFSLAFAQNSHTRQQKTQPAQTAQTLNVNAANSNATAMATRGELGFVRRRARLLESVPAAGGPSGEIVEPTAPSEDVIVLETELGEEVETQTLLGKEDAEIFSSMNQLQLPEDFLERALQEILPNVPTSGSVVQSPGSMPGQTKMMFQQKARDVREESEKVMDDFKREFIDKVLGGVERGMQGWIEGEVGRLEDVIMRSNDVVRKLYLQATNLQAQKNHLTERLRALEPNKLRLLALERELQETQREYKSAKKMVVKINQDLDALMARKRKAEQDVAGIVKFAGVLSTIRDGIRIGLILGLFGCIVVWFYLLIR